MRRLVSTHYTDLRKGIMIPEAEASNLSPCKTLAAIKALTYSLLRPTMLKISPASLSFISRSKTAGRG